MSLQKTLYQLLHLEQEESHLLRTPEYLFRWRTVLWFLLLLFVGSLIFVPWQQTSFGQGQVTAFTPLDRQQKVEAPIKGRIHKWYANEGDFVQKGQIIVELSDVDTELSERYKQQEKIILDRKKLGMMRVAFYEEKVAALKKARSMSIMAGKMEVKVARQKAIAQKQKLVAAEFKKKTEKLNYARSQKLYKSKLLARRKLEIVQLKVAKATSQVYIEKANLTAAKANILSKKAKLYKITAEMDAKVSTTLAEFKKTKTEVAYIQENLLKMKTSISRQNSRFVRAPRDCTLIKIVAIQASSVFKEGDLLAYIVPITRQNAVELWIDGNDAPLVQKGRKVRIQFEGWPALQFSGWPSVAVGTFGGMVSFVDAVINSKGKLRVVLIPDPKEMEWPKQEYLKQGVRAKGWLLLDQVSLGYEIWRRFNGFPPERNGSPFAIQKKSKKKK